jgi:ribosomal-protein-alanine N-acetyltransferase
MSTAERRSVPNASAAPVLDIEIMRRRHLKQIMPIENAVYPRPWSTGVFHAELDLARRDQRYYVVGLVDGDVVGYGGILFTPDDAHVTNIAVDPGWQRRGIASELLLELAWKAREHECQGWSLEVRVSNTAAQELYRRFGFVPAGVRKKYYENVEDAIVMWCSDLGTPEYAHRLREIENERAQRAGR